MPTNLNYTVFAMTAKSKAPISPASNLYLSVFLCIILCFFYYFFIHFSPAYAIEQTSYIQVPAATDLRTRFSDGRHSVEELVKMAKERGIEILIINDHHVYSLEYGIWPFEKIIKKKVEDSSVLKNGIESYLEEVEMISNKYPEIIIIPGLESSPFYYWTGNIFSNNLTAHKWENHIGIMGLERAEDIKGLPTLNGYFSIRYYNKYIYNTVFLSLSFILGILLIQWLGVYRYAGILICIFSILFIINFHPFQSSPFDQYHGDEGVAPWQETIDYVNSKGGITIWHHMESVSGIGKKGPISVNTPPHPEDLLKTYGYTGFQSIYEDTIHVADPGKEWDIVLSQYCAGNRKRAVWGIGGLDYHGEGESGIKLQDVKTIFFLKEKTKDDVYNALKNGKTYSISQQGKDYRLVLDEFSISDSSGNNKAISGDEIEVNGNPNIYIKVSTTNNMKDTVEVHLIRKGEVIKRYSGETPLEITYSDKNLLNSDGGKFTQGEKIYYRLNVQGKSSNYIISNPIFVKLLPIRIED